MCAVCVAPACDIWMSSPANKKGTVPYLAAFVALIIYLLRVMNSKCDLLRQFFFARQKIMGDNLALVTL